MAFFDNIKNLARSLPFSIFQSGENGPITGSPDDIACLIFSLLDEKNKVNLGRTCTRFNVTYLINSPIGFGCKKLFAALKNLSIDLAKATKERGFYTKESRRTSGDLLQPASSSTKTEDAALRLKAETISQTYSTAYFDELKVMNIGANNDNFGFFALFTQKMIRSSFKEIAEDGDATSGLFVKAETVIKDFQADLFDEMCYSYAARPMEEITINSFKHHVALMKGHFPIRGDVEIEAEIRKAIKTKHDSTELYRAKAEHLAAANSPTDPRFVASRAATEARLTAEKTSLEAELGAFHTKRIDEIAQYDNDGNLAGGKLHEVTANLAPLALDAVAAKEMQDAAKFYNALNHRIDDTNKYVRFQMLHAVIGE